MDRPHVPPTYSDRSFDGAQSMLARKSAEEAPEVASYNYDNVGTFAGLDGISTDFDALNRSQLSTSMYGHVGKEAPKYDPTVLLNDAWFCIVGDDGSKLYQILTTLQKAGVPYPADYKYETMFGETSLWERINDDELFKVPSKNRGDARTLLARFRSPPPATPQFTPTGPVDIYDRRAFLR